MCGPHVDEDKGTRKAHLLLGGRGRANLRKNTDLFRSWMRWGFVAEVPEMALQLNSQFRGASGNGHDPATFRRVDAQTTRGRRGLLVVKFQVMFLFLPYSEAGIVPVIFMSPHSVPSR